jgi:hypothetical protein
LAKPNYQFEKRQRDLAKKAKQEEKRRQKLAGKAKGDDAGGSAEGEQSAEGDAAAAPPDGKPAP